MFATRLEGVCYCYAVAVIQSVIMWLVFGLESTGVWTTVVALAVLLCIPLVVACLYFGALFLHICAFLLPVVHFAYVCVRCGVSSLVELGVLLLDILRLLLDFEGFQVWCLW